MPLRTIKTLVSTGSVYITTRQDIQFHYIPLENTALLQRHLGAYGIATREAELIPAIEAVLSVHDKYSDRKRKMRSRIKFLVDRFGEALFREKIEKEFERCMCCLGPAAI